MKKPTFILTADWHLREVAPVSRTDDFWGTQWKKVQFISQLSEKHDCPVIHAGDLFHHWKPSPYLLNYCMQYLPERFYTVYGNHDLPQHNLELSERCGVDVLKSAGRIVVLENTHFGKELIEESFVAHPKFAVWHVFTYKGELPWPGCTEKSAKKILRKYKAFDLILTGDNHKTFTEEHKGRLLVNPGSLMRQSADQVEHKPCVFLYYAETNTVKPVYLPVEEDVISRKHIENKEERNERIDAFVTSLNTDFDSEISFHTNLKKFYAKNRIQNEIKTLIQKFVEL
jgi:DNA repair exonuclease SbcCD nuclease subunit